MDPLSSVTGYVKVAFSNVNKDHTELDVQNKQNVPIQWVPFVAGGEAIKPGDWKSIVMIWNIEKKNWYLLLCGGFLISTR